MIDANLVPRLVQFLQDSNRSSLQLEAAWILSNVASGTREQTRFVVDSGCITIFLRLLTSPNAEVRDQVIWALGNIAGDSVSCRDTVLLNGGFQALLNFANVSLIF